jgi:multidrug efflux pump subunit AcrA (membrane-fusion protein)
MKTLTTIAVVGIIGMAAASSSFAQSNPTPPAGTPSTTLAQTSTIQDGTWVAPYGQSIPGKTRAQVYQELVRARQDGQLAYLNSTLYAHH